jgi:hypothetical protein
MPFPVLGIEIESDGSDRLPCASFLASLILKLVDTRSVD